MSGSPVRVDFYFAVPSRYSYLASTRIAALEREFGCVVDWRAVSTQAITRAAGRDPFAGTPASGQYDWHYRMADAARWADFYGVPWREPRGRLAYEPDLLARAAVVGARLGMAEAAARALFRAVFVEDLRVLDRAGCIERLVAAGAARDAVEVGLDAPETMALLENHVCDAASAGVFGVPSFVVEGEVYWGNDRLPLLRHFLATRGGD